MKDLPVIAEVKKQGEQVEPLLSHSGDFFSSLEAKLDNATLSRIKAADFQYVHDLATELSKQAQSERSSVMEARLQKFHKRSGANLVELAESSKKFLNSFRNIKDIAIGVDQQIGPLIYGTIAVIVTLGSNKQLQDDLTTEMLCKFDKLLSRLPNILYLEMDNEMIKSHVINIYVPMIALLGDSIRYYTQPSWRRVIQALTKPPTEYLQEKISEVTKRVADLIQELTIIQLEELKRLHRRKDSEEDDLHSANLKHVARVFGHSMDGLATEKMYSDCKALYGMRLKYPRTDHRSPRPKPYILEHPTLQMLSQRQGYKQWREHPSSCLLLLGGENFRSYAPQQECWLSPLATELCSDIRSGGNSMVALCSLITLSHIHRPTALVQLALKTIIMQLLEQDKRLCRQCHGHVAREYSRARNMRDWPSHPVLHSDPSSEIWEMETNTLSILLNDVLSSIQELVSVYIVLDGVEKLGEDRPTDLFRSLFDSLNWLGSEQPKPIVKILAFCFPQRWPSIQRSQSLAWELKGKLGLHGQAQGMKHVFYDLEWKQGAQV